MALGTMDGCVVRQNVVVAGVNGSKGSPHDAREEERESRGGAVNKRYLRTYFLQPGSTS